MLFFGFIQFTVKFYLRNFFFFFKREKNEKKNEYLPSLFMPICRHFLSRQAWHWFRCALSTIQRPVPAWHLVVSPYENWKRKRKKKQIKTWDWWQNKAESNNNYNLKRRRYIKKKQVGVYKWFEWVFNQIRKAPASNLHFDWKKPRKKLSENFGFLHGKKAQNHFAKNPWPPWL